MAKLGTEKKPAVVRVGTEARARKSSAAARKTDGRRSWESSRMNRRIFRMGSGF